MRADHYHGKPCIHGHGTLRYAKGKGCVICVTANAHRRWLKGPDEWKAQRRATYATPEGRADRRNRNLLQHYGMTLDDYDAMLEAQGGRCALCGTSEPTGSSGKFHVDHDHRTGRIRGLLCHKCNLGLGSFNDSTERLELAIAYLEKHAHPS